MYVLFINISVKNWNFATEEGIAMSFLTEPVYCMTWIWTLHRVYNKLKSPIEAGEIFGLLNCMIRLMLATVPLVKQINELGNKQTTLVFMNLL